MNCSLVSLPRPDQDATLIREWLRSKRSPHAQRAYVRDIATFYEQVQKPLDQVTLTDLQDYADWLRQEHPTVSTQARMLASVKSLLTFAKNTGGNRFNVGMALQLPQCKDTLAQRILSPAQVHRMLYVAEQSGNQRNHVKCEDEPLNSKIYT
jgi:site-specific recombinase XerD